MAETEQDINELERLSSSGSMLRLVDALRGLDRETVSQLLSAYLYFRSEGRPNKEFLDYLLRRRLYSLVTVLFTLVPAVAPGLLFDGKFRSLLLGAALSRTPRRDAPRKS
jgi:hypothetical protein